MSEQVLDLNSIPRSRRHALVFPREHGAWGMMLVPLLTGGILGLLRGGHLDPVVLLTLACLALFWLRTPVETLLGTSLMRAQTPEERHLAWRYTISFSLLATLLIGALFWGGSARGLAILGGVAALTFLAQAGIRRLGRTWRMPAQLIGAISLTSTAPAAYYVATGSLDKVALALWLANWLFAGDQIHYVQVRIHSANLSERGEKLRQGRAFLLGHAILVAVLFAAWSENWLPALAVIAFVPVVVRGLAWYLQARTPLVVRRLGWTEMVHAVVFGTLLIVGFHIHF